MKHLHFISSFLSIFFFFCFIFFHIFFLHSALTHYVPLRFEVQATLTLNHQINEWNSRVVDFKRRATKSEFNIIKNFDWLIPNLPKFHKFLFKFILNFDFKIFSSFYPLWWCWWFPIMSLFYHFYINFLLLFLRVLHFIERYYHNLAKWWKLNGIERK